MPPMDPRQDLIRHYQWLRRHGLNDSHSGNASIRDGERVWVTPTGACADTLVDTALVACHPGQAITAGASLDAALHLGVYSRNPGAGAVLHSHGPYSVAFSFTGTDFVPDDFEGQYYFPRVPVLNIPYDQYLDQAATAVAETLAEHPICMVRGHGVYSWGETMNLAYKWTCSLEQSAKTAWIARQAGFLS